MFVEQIVFIFSSAIDAVQGWFVKVFSASGMTSFFFGCLTVYLAVRFLIKPIVGGGLGSDRARKKKGDDE